MNSRGMIRWLAVGWACAVFALLVLPHGVAPAQAPAKVEDPAAEAALPAEWIKALQWRSIGPANMGGRITAISVFENDPSTFWVATASGGLLRTINNGITFEHQFDKEATVSIGDVCVAPSNRDIVWVGTGEANPRNSVSYGDGVYKSTDGGKTWKNMGLKKSFQIGRILVHPTNPDIVYVGALGRLWGPNEERGLYKTTDGGKSWEKILYIDERTGVIDIRMHPNDPDILLAATYERRRDGFDSNEPIQRYSHASGLHKSTDGGKTWKPITAGLPTCKRGRIGIDWYRKDPNIVYAIVESEKMGMAPAGVATGEPYLGIQGENAGDDKGARLVDVFKDGPAEKAGLKPGDVITRFADKDVKTYEQLIDAINAVKPKDKVKVALHRENQGKEIEVVVGERPMAQGTAFLGVQGEDAGDEKGARLTQVTANGPAAKAGLQVGDVIRKIGDKEIKTYGELLETVRGERANAAAKFLIVRNNEEKTIEVVYGVRQAGRDDLTDPTRPFGAMLAGQRENIQGRQGPEGHEYGGVYRSEDGGETWKRVNSVNPRPMYFSKIRVDPSDDRIVYVLGISLFRSMDGGKTFRADAGRGIHADQHALWINPKDGRHMIVGTDGGHYVTYDRGANWDHLNTAAIGQFYHVAVDTRREYRVYGGLQDNGTWGGPSRTRTQAGPINEDWISILGGDGFRCQIDALDPDLVYATSQNGGLARRNLRTNEVAQIRPQGQPGQRFRWNWSTPFILSHHNSKIYYTAANYVFRSVDRGNRMEIISPEITATNQGSATALAESPRNPNVLYVGTDDGNLWVTRNGGKDWSNITKNVSLPGPRWVASIDCSRFADGRAYVVFDGHRSDDDEPYVFVTEDFGQNWKSLRSNLPWGSTRVCREDLVNPDLLYLGTEFACWASLDRGQTWTRINNNLPTVAIHEIAIHPTAGEIVAATHGRSLWVLDVSALRQIKPESLKAAAAIYKPMPAVKWISEPARGRTNRRFVGENPPQGALIYYSLAAKAERASIRIFDIEGKLVRELAASTEPGLHRFNWNLAGPPQTGGPDPGRPPRPGRPTPGGRPVPAGDYRVVLTVGGKDYVTSLKVENDPRMPAPAAIAEDEIEEDDSP